MREEASASLECFGYSGAGVLHQPSGAPLYSSRPAPLQLFSDGSFGRGVLGQHHNPVVYSQAGGHVLAILEPRGLASPSLGVTLVPQFFMGAQNVVADSLSRQDKVIGSEWTLAHGVGRQVGEEVASDGRPLCHLHQLSSSRLAYFSPLSDPMSAGMDAFL